jgi:NAD(P)-dependent dehydrogenase (short-subunit alcohol dehydrogenase family)
MENQVALITGGSRGIGLAIAQELARSGIHIAINGVRDDAQVTDVINDLKATGSDVMYCQGDVSTPDGRQHVIEKVRTHYGRLHILVNNAGVGPIERVDPLKATQESYQKVMRINLEGPYFLTQLVANWMVEQKIADHTYKGCIINIGSISATVISPERGEYCISKAGFSMHSKIWAVRMAEFGIPVFEVRPGIIKTDMTARVTEKYDRLIGAGLTVQNRWGLPADVARSVKALVLGDFPYSTGEVFMVDGGLTLQRL